MRGVSYKVLIQHLKELEADLIVVRKDFKELRVEYSPTEFGSSLIETLTPSCEGGRQNMNKDAEVNGRNSLGG